MQIISFHFKSFASRHNSVCGGLFNLGTYNIPEKSVQIIFFFESNNFRVTKLLNLKNIWGLEALFGTELSRCRNQKMFLLIWYFFLTFCLWLLQRQDTYTGIHCKTNPGTSNTCLRQIVLYMGLLNRFVCLVFLQVLLKCLYVEWRKYRVSKTRKLSYSPQLLHF